VSAQVRPVSHLETYSKSVVEKKTTGKDTLKRFEILGDIREISGLASTWTDLTSCTNSDRDTTLITFQEFNDSSRKNKQLTVTEVFTKMLLRLKCLSVDIAQTMARRRLYPTPRDMIEAYTTWQ
jgi:hypothetical protein